MAESQVGDPLNTGVSPTPGEQALAMAQPETVVSAPAPSPAAMLMTGLPPEPAPGGISEHPSVQLRRQIARNADTLANANPTAASAPGGWARALLGGAMSAIGGGGLFLGTPQAGPLESTGISGAQNAMNARRAMTQQAQDRAAATKKEAFEEDQKTRELKMKEETHDYAVAFNKIAIAKAMSTWDQEEQDSFHKQFYEPWAKDEKENKGASLIQEKMSSQELSALAKQHAAADDPNGTHWLSKQDIRPDGWVTDVDPNTGHPIPETDSNGKPTGRNQRTQTWSAWTYGDPMPISQETADAAKKYGLGQNFKGGDVMDPRDAALLKVQIGKAIVDEHSADELALAAGKTKESLSELQQKANYRLAGAAFTPWLVDSKGDAGLALKNMVLHSQETDEQGNQTAEAKQALQQYQLVRDTMGSDIVKSAMEEFNKEEVERVKAAAKDANSKDKAQGDTNLTGIPYLNSIQDGSERSLVKMIGTGQIPPARMEYLIARNPRVMQEVSLAFPGLDAARFPAYIDASKKFTSGPIANQINSAGTSIKHLKALFDDNNTPLSFVPGSKAYARRESDLNDASLELARFLTGGTAPSNLDVEGAKHSLNPTLLSLDPQGSRNEAVKTQVDRIFEKINQYQDQWTTAMPSEQWKKPMPGWFSANQTALDYIRNDGKPPVQAYSVTLPDGTPITFQTEAQMNQFKQAAGLK